MLPRCIHVVAHLAFRNANGLIASQFQLLYLQTVFGPACCSLSYGSCSPPTPTPCSLCCWTLHFNLQQAMLGWSEHHCVSDQGPGSGTAFCFLLPFRNTLLVPRELGLFRWRPIGTFFVPQRALQHVRSSRCDKVQPGTSLSWLHSTPNTSERFVGFNLLDLQAVWAFCCGCWDPIVGPLGEQKVFLTCEPSL